MKKIIIALFVLICVKQLCAQTLTSGGKLKPEQAIMDIRHYTIALNVDFNQNNGVSWGGDGPEQPIRIWGNARVEVVNLSTEIGEVKLTSCILSQSCSHTSAPPSLAARVYVAARRSADTLHHTCTHASSSIRQIKTHDCKTNANGHSIQTR